MKRWRIVLALLAIGTLVGTVTPAAGAQATRTLKGKVTRLGEPVVGVGVIFIDAVANVPRATCTDEAGKYKFPKASVGSGHGFFVGRTVGTFTQTDGTAPCTNLDFEAPTGKDWLNYRHPDIHGALPETGDTFTIPAGDTPFKIRVRLKAARQVCFGYKATIVGTSGPDVIDGTPGNDIVRAKGGKDLVTGRGGNDVICGDGGNDTLKGGSGIDLLVGGSGKRDRLVGGAGFDFCVDAAYRKADCEAVNP